MLSFQLFCFCRKFPLRNFRILPFFICGILWSITSLISFEEEKEIEEAMAILDRIKGNYMPRASKYSGKSGSLIQMRKQHVVSLFILGNCLRIFFETKLLSTLTATPSPRTCMFLLRKRLTGVQIEVSFLGKFFPKDLLLFLKVKKVFFHQN